MKCYFTEPGISLRLKLALSNDSCRYSFVIVSVDFILNNERVITQHTYTAKCVDICSDGKVLYICLSNFCQIFSNLGYNYENSVFFFKCIIIILM